MSLAFDCTTKTLNLARYGAAARKKEYKAPPSQVRNYSPGNMEQASSRGHEASLQSGVDVGCKLRPSSKTKLRGLSVRAQARRISISLSFSVAFFFPRSCLPRAARRGATLSPRGFSLLEHRLQPTPSPLCGLASWPLLDACSMFPGE